MHSLENQNKMNIWHLIEKFSAFLYYIGDTMRELYKLKKFYMLHNSSQIQIILLWVLLFFTIDH